MPEIDIHLDDEHIDILMDNHDDPTEFADIDDQSTTYYSCRSNNKDKKYSIECKDVVQISEVNEAFNNLYKKMIDSTNLAHTESPNYSTNYKQSIPGIHFSIHSSTFFQVNNIKILPEFRSKEFVDALPVKMSVTVLNLAHNAFSNLPKTFFKFYLEIYKLDLSYNNFKSISNTRISSLKSLTTINLGHNLLAEVNLTDFNKFFKLKYLYLGNNPLKTFNHFDKSNLPALETFDVSHCNLTYEPLNHTKIFPSQLKNFNINNNPVLWFPIPFINSVISIRVNLSIENCSIVCSCQNSILLFYLSSLLEETKNPEDKMIFYRPMCTWPSGMNKSALQWYMDRNKTCEIKCPVKMPCDCMENTLNIISCVYSSYKVIQDIICEAADALNVNDIEMRLVYITFDNGYIPYDFLTNIKFTILHIISSGITELRDKFLGSTRKEITLLSLVGNLITRLNEFTFMDGGEIILLSLKSNKISQIHPGSLGRRYLEKLQVLDLSDNEITYLPSIDFSVRLSNLSLAHNPLKTIDYKFEPISIVQLSNSNLRCGCSIYSLSIVISKGTVLLNPDGKENVCSYNTDNNDLKNSSKKSITKNLPNKAIKSLINDKFLSDNCSDQINIVSFFVEKLASFSQVKRSGFLGSGCSLMFVGSEVRFLQSVFDLDQ
ncbi:uncharacterized protein LOC135926724 [Gordionus sp. m RMFG-2023]|uniref:uncharacterized protein LOC135926724 n=1 Tax=Gordionus sp. m RMFG-2023 TaxID=3053472 RepID=UPI0031FDCCDA